MGVLIERYSYPKSMSSTFPRFGVWALVHGSRAALQDPDEPYDASWARNKALVLEAERLGYDSVLVAQHTINPHDPSLDQLEAWTASAALAALTSRIEIIAAIKPYLYHPVVLAKMAQQIEHISGGRFAINLVNAWNRPELERAGIGFAEHDERYAYGREWITVVDALLRGETVHHHGDHFRIDGYRLLPADPFRTRPRIYVGGESEPARSLVAAHGDTWFINGQPADDVAPRHGSVRAPLDRIRVERDCDRRPRHRCDSRRLRPGAADQGPADHDPRAHREGQRRVVR